MGIFGGNPMLDFLSDFFTNRAIAEILFFWAGVVMPIATVLVILYARAQVKTIAKQAQATLLLDLLDKWNSEEMKKAKVIYLTIVPDIKVAKFQEHANLNDQDSMNKLKDHFKTIIDKLFNEDRLGDYVTLMQMMNFFESIGMLVKNKYIPFADMDALFRGPIIDASRLFVLHVEGRQNEKGAAPGLYENALFLFSKTEKSCPK
jgi:hypothetical protein